jgi:predicted nucleic acid-binding protein
LRALFLDSSGWFASFTPREFGHESAAKQYAVAVNDGARLLTTSMVVAEMHALVLRRGGTRLAQEFLDSALNPDALHVVHPDAELVSAAVSNWVRRYADKSFSLCDAVSFEVMRRERVQHALTLDHHFAIAGFEILS